MKKRTFFVFFLLLSLLLFGCAASQEESVIESTEKESPKESMTEIETEHTSDTYYRMSYTKAPIDIDKIMHALLTDEDEKAAFDATILDTSTLSDGRIQREGAMTVHGTAYQWSECAGFFIFYKEYTAEPVPVKDAEKLARDFLDQLGWEYCDELQIRSAENGTVDILCRLCYQGVKLMGSHTLYFEPGNEDELGLTGSYIQLTLSGTDIVSAMIESVPQDGDILQTYDSQKDLLSLKEAEAMAEQYIETEGSQLLLPDEELISEEMSIERIYMPYRDAANGNTDILMPAYEVRIPCKAEEMPDGAIVLYMDALTGYIYDISFEFY